MNRSLAIPLIILVVLLVAYFIIDSSRDVTSTAEMFFDVDTAKVDGIIIHNKDNVINLKKSGAVWRVAEPIDYPADVRYINDLMRKLGSMTVANLVTTDTDKDSLYGLDTAAVEVMLSAAGEEAAHFHIGKTADNHRHTYCRMIGEDEIYRVKGTFSGQFKRKQKDWRDKKIIEIDQELISRVDFEYPNENFSLVKGDTLWSLDSGNVSKPVEQRFLNQTLSVLSRLRTFDFLDGDSARAVDFSKPDLKFSIITYAGDAYNFAIVPQESDENRYYLKKEGLDETIFIIYKGTANSIMKHPADFEPVEKG